MLLFNRDAVSKRRLLVRKRGRSLAGQSGEARPEMLGSGGRGVALASARYCRCCRTLLCGPSLVGAQGGVFCDSDRRTMRPPQPGHDPVAGVRRTVLRARRHHPHLQRPAGPEVAIRPFRVHRACRGRAAREGPGRRPREARQTPTPCYWTWRGRGGVAELRWEPRSRHAYRRRWNVRYPAGPAYRQYLAARRQNVRQDAQLMVSRRPERESKAHTVTRLLSAPVASHA